MYPATPISDEFTAKYANQTPPWGFGDLGFVIFKRTYARARYDENGELLRTEEWHETLQRVVNGAQAIGAGFTQEEAERLFDYMWHLKGLAGGRMLWQLGTPNVQRFGLTSLCNCWWVNLNSPEDFGWLLETLMLGGGVGFSVNNPEVLGVVRAASVALLDESDADFITPDKREGWAELIVRVLKTYLGGKDQPKNMTYSTQLIRKAGVPIRTFGGVASGPSILVDGIEDICRVLDGATNRYLYSTEVLDIANIIGRIVVSGNIRRSAEIGLGSYNDTRYLQAKRWDLGNIPNWRAISNNSVIVNTDEIGNLPDEFWQGYLGNGEPYGLFNLETSQRFGRMGEERPDYTISGINPCAELPLAHRESCNLCEIFLPNVESRDEFIDLAKLLLKIQKAVASLPSFDQATTEIVGKNRRLGLGITGIAQAFDKLNWLSPAYEELRRFDKEWSALRGWPESVRLTTTKPSGTLSLLGGTTPGIHPGYSRWHLRRVRMAYDDPALQWCRKRGYHTESVKNFDGTEDVRTIVVEFPCTFPEQTLLADSNLTAVQQLNLLRRIQREWADNSISVTIYYTLEELDEIKEYLGKYWGELKSVSFLLRNGHGFAQAPLEEITEAEYQFALLRINHDIPLSLETGTSTLVEDGTECEGACPIK